MICPYCNKEAVYGDNSMIYGINYGKSYKCYYCKDCNAYVGCHNNTTIPFGTMANAELREWRKATHDKLDPIRLSGKISKRKIRRSNLYKRLNKYFGKEIHIGESDIDMCKQIIAFLDTIKR